MDSEKKTLTAKDVCDIIESCAKHGITELKFGDLQLGFKPKTESHVTAPLTNPTGEEIPETKHEEQTKAALEQDEATLKADRMNQMFLEDPLAAESLLENEELEDDDDDDNAEH